MEKSKFIAKPLTSPPNHHFFGYYDKSPWNDSMSHLLVHEVDFIDRMPRPDDEVKICVIDLKNNNKEIIHKTKAWNWQQGSMLQWVGPDYRDKIVFNDRNNGKFVSVLMDISNESKKIISTPVYAVHPDGKEALSLNFSRLDRLREGYGYKGLEDNFKRELAPDKDGIFKVDLDSGKRELIISIKDLYEKDKLPFMDEGQHWVNHLTYNPNGTRFAFLHRFQRKNNRIYTRLCTADSDGSNLRLILDSGMVSHFSWRNNEEIVAWGRSKSLASKVERNSKLLSYLFPLYNLIKPKGGFFRGNFIGDSYLLIKDDKNGEIRRIGRNKLDRDGHCSVSPVNENLILTDTYPSRKHYRSLILYDLKTNKKVVLNKFYSLPDKKYIYMEEENWDLSGIRCDLHPRWSPDGSKVCIDSVHEGSRQVYSIDISENCGR